MASAKRLQIIYFYSIYLRNGNIYKGIMRCGYQTTGFCRCLSGQADINSGIHIPKKQIRSRINECVAE
jgi:hypothetical protein